LNQSINQSINHGGEGTLFILEFAACHGASLAGAISVIVKSELERQKAIENRHLGGW